LVCIGVFACDEDEDEDWDSGWGWGWGWGRGWGSRALPVTRLFSADTDVEDAGVEDADAEDEVAAAVAEATQPQGRQ
jgi:hypothetical protein